LVLHGCIYERRNKQGIGDPHGSDVKKGKLWTSNVPLQIKKDRRLEKISNRNPHLSVMRKI
jgi:hypothetical protein